MVVVSRVESKAEFSKSLHGALDTFGAPTGRARKRWLAKLMGVAYETARKWLEGITIPDQTNKRRLAKHIGIDVSELFAGVRSPTHDDAWRELDGLWPILSDETKRSILAIAHINAAKKPLTNPLSVGTPPPPAQSTLNR